MLFLILLVFISQSLNCMTPTYSSTYPFSSIFGSQFICNRKDIISLSFFHGIPSDFINTTILNSGIVQGNNSMAEVCTGTDTNGSAIMQSKVGINYVPAHMIYAFFSLALSTAESNSEQWMGCIDENNGYAIGYKGASFGILYRREAIETFIPQPQFSEDRLDGSGIKSRINLDPTKINVYRISYGWLGGASVKFEILREDNFWFPFHIIKFPNLSATTSTPIPGFPLRAEAKKTSGSTTNLILRTASWCGGIEDGTIPFSRTQEVSRQNISISSTERPVLTIKNNSTYLSKNNTNWADLIYANFLAIGAVIRLKIYKNATLTSGNLSYTNKSNSFISYNTGATGFSGGEEVFYIPVSVNFQQMIFNGWGLHLFLFPGESFTLTASTPIAAYLDFCLTWKETL